MKKFFSFFAAMLIAVAANAAVINITNETPDALRLALNSAADGDEIVMAAGTYVESNGNYIAFDGKSVTVKAAEGANVLIQPQVPITITNGAYAKFENIKFDVSRLTELATWYEHLIYATDANEANSLSLKGCEFYGFTLNKSMLYCSSSNRLANVYVDNCYFHNIMKSILFVESTAAIKVQITNSTIANITTDASSYYAGVIDVRATDADFLVDHCTFYDAIPMNTDYSAVSKVTITKGVVSNSIFMLATAQDGIRAMRGVTANNCITYNYLKDSGTGIHSSVTKNNCTQVDPKFVDAANGNYTLGEGSPALTMNDGQPIGDPRWVPSVAPEVKYYLKNNWDAASDWTWKEMTKLQDGNYQLEGVVFGGTGVNINTAESDEGSDWYPIEKIAAFDTNDNPTTLKAKDTVVFVYTPSEKSLAAIVVGPYVEPSGVEHTYTVAGSSAVAFGSAWDPTNTANDMAKQDDGSYKWEKANLELPAGTIEFKVCQDHAWTTAWPAQNYALNVSEAATYTLKITFTPASGNVGAELVKTGSAEIDPTVSAKGGWDSWAAEVVFVLADNKETATGALNLEPGNYEFKVILNGGDWRSNGYSYHREFTGADNITGNGDNMVLKADIAGEYTLTWTFATNALNITFPVASGIDNTNVAVKAQKMIINGQLFIIRDGQMFNAQGQLQ